MRWIGRRFPLNCTSPGKLVLAALPEAELGAFLARPIEACTPLTLTDPAAIRAELAEVRTTGIATSIGDHELGVIGISAAARDAAGRPVAIVSVTGPDVRLTAARLDAIAPLVRSAADELARALDATGEEMTVAEERDVVIVGGGIAGLVCAHRLRDRDPVVLEASDRVGGRIWSKQRGDLALSVGAHMFPPPDSVIGKIVTELGLQVMPITGSMLNIHLGGRMVRDVRPELLPFRLPLSPPGRASFARAG